MRKSINSATQKFEDQITEELVLDAVPTVNSFNGVTSDGVARAIAGASGEVPQVTESDNGKVLKAIYDEGGPAVEWADVPSGVPEYSAADEGKVLGVITEGVEDTPALGWVEQPADELPSYTTSEDGKVLGVVDNSGTAELQWVGQQGGAVIVTPSSSYEDVLAAYTAGKPVVFKHTVGNINFLYALTKYDSSEGNYAYPGVFLFTQWTGSTVDGYTHVLSGNLGVSMYTCYRNGNGATVWSTEAKYPLPTVSSGDSGKALRVNSSGKWAPATISEVPASTAADENKVLTVNSSGSPVWAAAQGGGGDQPLPASPAYSLRFQFSDPSFDPTTPLAVTNGTWSAVDAAKGIWDFTYQNSNWTDVFIGKFVASIMGNVHADIIGGDLAGVTHAEHLFADCDRIKKFNLECDISSMVSMAYLFGQWNGGATQELAEFNLKTTNTSNSTHLSAINGMFQFCDTLKKVSITINGSAPEAGYFLSGAGHLTECTLRGFTGLRDPSYAFNGTTSLESLKIVLQPGNRLFNLTSDCTSMFNGCGLKHMQNEIPPLDCTNVTGVASMFEGAYTQDLPMMVDTGSITDFTGFCQSNNSLRAIPFIDVSSAADVGYMFNGCSNVQSGALALYKQLAAKATPPSTTTGCFTNCGSGTVSGNDELAKIPTSYGGLGYENASTASVTLSVNDLVVSDSVDVTSITVNPGVTSGIVQWVVNSTTTLPTVTDGTNALKAAVNNPSSLTVGRTVQVSILNGTWVCAEFA